MRALRALLGLVDLLVALGMGFVSLWALGWQLHGGAQAMLPPVLSLLACWATGAAGAELLLGALRNRQSPRVVFALHVGAAVLWMVCALNDNPAAMVLWGPLLAAFVGAGWLAEPRGGADADGGAKPPRSER